MNKLTLVAAAALLCGTAGAASHKAPAGTDTVCAVPYYENFNDSSKVLNEKTVCDYKGWTIFGASGNTKRFKVRINSTLNPAGDGMYLVNSVVYGARNDWAISPAVKLKAGKQYTVACKILATGGTNSLKEHIRITVGSDTTEAAQGTVLLDLPQANYKTWTEVTAEFTPTADGDYYFGFNNNTAQRGYVVAIDDVSVTTADSNEAVAAFDLPAGGVYTENNEMLLYPDNQLKFTNRSQNATSYLWTTGGNPATTTEKNPVVNYPESGTCQVTLLAANEGGDSLATATLAVRVVGDAYSGKVKTSATADSLNAQDGTISILPASTEYKTGYNSRYTKIAERFDMPERSVATVSAVELAASRYSTSYLLYHVAHPVTVKLVADSLGLPCESEELGRVSTTLEALYGTSGASDTTSAVTFISPVSVSGPFHVVVDFGTAENSLSDYIALRSYTRAQSAPVTFSVCPTSGWTTLKAITGADADSLLALDIKAQMAVSPRTSTGIASVVDTTYMKVSVNGRTIGVSGLERGSVVRVYNMLGACVSTAEADAEGIAVIDAANWPASAYVLANSNGKSAKLIIR